MFTGIIQAQGTIAELESAAGGSRLVVDPGPLDMSDVGPGDSISINGVCLTVIDIDGGRFSADVSRETLACTTLSGLTPGSPVNLEKAMAAADRFGGHFVAGHVDGVGVIERLAPEGESIRCDIGIPRELARYAARKGSLCVDGVSLTINDVRNSTVSFNIIPHTMRETIFRTYEPGRRVNLEVDIIARYLERLLEASH